MGKGSEQAFVQRRHIKDQQTEENDDSLGKCKQIKTTM